MAPTPTTGHIPSAAAAGRAKSADSLGASEATALAQEAWVFGMPLVYIAMQIDTATHVNKPTGPLAPINQFAHYREFPDANNRTIVGLNVDTLYSLAWLDLSQEPMVLSVPDMGTRFWVMQFIDAWNNVPFAPGSRTLGGKGGNFAIVGPDWKGTLPAGLTELRSPTSLIMIGGRTYTAGKDDYAAVHALQDQYRLVPLSAWGMSYTPPTDVPLKPGIDSKTPLPRQVLAMSADSFFNRLNALLTTNAPVPDDPALMSRIAKLGIGPGAKFDSAAFSPELRKAIDNGIGAGQKLMRETPMGKDVNGWRIALDLGRYGTKYAYRATWTFFGVGGNLAEDAVYPVAEKDADGNPLDGSHQYVLQFAKDEIPPVNAFWSVTLYDAESYFVPNPINRYSLGDRSGMKFYDDGSLMIYIQSESPGKDKESNWLPAPAQGGFKLALRLYAPKDSVANGSWKPPGVMRVH